MVFCRVALTLTRHTDTLHRHNRHSWASAHISSYPTVPAAAATSSILTSLPHSSTGEPMPACGHGVRSTASISMETVPTVPVRTRLPRLAYRSARYAGSRQHNRRHNTNPLLARRPVTAAVAHRIAGLQRLYTDDFAAQGHHRLKAAVGDILPLA
ncbi:Uncharacterised protein [Enterobacter cloacae]|uniref:Uncharacterized protein n=1 Tax=Enterobacter cloacae TaxID=550 RepID=A0A377LYW4_ENTCL|nr:Uncharacterised protein [Enterobacter cloacae]